MTNPLIKSMARDFSKSALTEIATGAKDRAKILRTFGFPTTHPEEWDAAHAFDQVAAYCQKILELQED